jgi:hypothetical protein
MDEHPNAPAREIARLAGVSEGVIKNLNRRRLQAKIDSGDHVVEADDMISIEVKPVKNAEPVQTDTTSSDSQGPTIWECQTVESEGTTRNSRIVEKIEEAPIQPEPERAETPADQKPENAEILQKTDRNQSETSDQAEQPPNQEPPKVEDVNIVATEDLRAKALQLRTEGKNVKEIAELLNVRWQWVRGICAFAGREKKAVECEATTQPEDKTSKPGPKCISRAELDQKIWAAWKAGKTPDQISDELCAEGYYYGRGSVAARLRAQGAKL